MKLKKINEKLKNNNNRFVKSIKKAYSFKYNFEQFFGLSICEIEYEITKNKNSIYALLIAFRLAGFNKAYNDIVYNTSAIAL